MSPMSDLSTGESASYNRTAGYGALDLNLNFIFNGTIEKFRPD